MSQSGSRPLSKPLLREVGSLFQEVDAYLQVKAKVSEDSLNALPLALLLQCEHVVVVEELLQLLLGEADAQLLEAVELWDENRKRGSAQMQTELTPGGAEGWAASSAKAGQCVARPQMP